MRKTHKPCVPADLGYLSPIGIGYMSRMAGHLSTGITMRKKCYNCGTTEAEAWYSPHWIAMKVGYHYCAECFKRLYPKGDRFCGLRSDR